MLFWFFSNNLLKIMNPCLLQDLPYTDYKAAEALPIERCEIIAKLANLKINLHQSKTPGKLLIHTLDRYGFRLKQYKEFLSTAMNTKIVKTFYKPQSKVAVLIANDRYLYLSRLATPSIDCDYLGFKLKSLGFIVVTIKNSLSKDLKGILVKVFDEVPENSYCLVFYAGHGCEVCNTKCILCIDCPAENMTSNHYVTENYIINTVAKCKPELVVEIMDMCRINLDRITNPELYTSILSTEPMSIHKNILMAYSTCSSSSAYELVEIECSMTIDNNVTYEIKTGDTDRIVPNSSQYVSALCPKLQEDWDVSTLLDRVHSDVEKSLKKQKPIKVQCGTDKRSFYDPTTANTEAILTKLKEIGNIWECFNAF